MRSSPLSSSAAIAASASPMKDPERREVVASQRIPCAAMGVAQKAGELQPVRLPVAEGAGVAADQHADAGRRAGAAETRGIPAGGVRLAHVDGRRRQADEVIGVLGQALQGHEHQRDVLWRQPAQAAAEDVGGAEHLCRGGIGSQRLAARRDDDVRGRQRARAQAIAETQDAGRGGAGVDELQQGARGDDEPAPHLEAGGVDRPAAGRARRSRPSAWW